MARIFITGSADGLGLLAAKQLIAEGHNVVLHARNTTKAQQLLKEVPDAEKVLIADISSMEETKNMAAQVNELGTFDAIIHNAGVYQVSSMERTIDGLPLLFAVNTLAPYILTCLIKKPGRIIYISSAMHLQGDSTLKNISKESIKATYSDSKLHDLILAKAVARKWNGIYSNAVDPGWVPTKMGGSTAPDNLEKGYETQVWLAVSNDEKAKVNGRYFHHKKDNHYLSKSDDVAVQENFLDSCAQICGIPFPEK